MDFHNPEHFSQPFKQDSETTHIKISEEPTTIDSVSTTTFLLLTSWNRAQRCSMMPLEARGLAQCSCINSLPSTQPHYFHPGAEQRGFTCIKGSMGRRGLLQTERLSLMVKLNFNPILMHLKPIFPPQNCGVVLLLKYRRVFASGFWWLFLLW